MIKEFKEKTVYDFLHLFISGHLKREELTQSMIGYLEESPKEFRANVMDNLVLLQYTFDEITADIACRFDTEFEKWEDDDIMRRVAAQTKVLKIKHEAKSKYFTISEAAKLLKKTPRSIHNYIEKGKLIREYVDEKPMILGDSLRAITPNM